MVERFVGSRDVDVGGAGGGRDYTGNMGEGAGEDGVESASGKGVGGVDGRDEFDAVVVCIEEHRCLGG